MKQHKSFETQLIILSLFPSLALLILLLWVMVYAQISTPLILLVALIFTIVISYACITINHKVVYQSRNVSNLLEAIMQGDYSLRASTVGQKADCSAQRELSISINALADTLKQQRMESRDSQMLLRMVINYIDVAIFALDSQDNISLMNPTAKKLLSASTAQGDLEQQIKAIQKTSRHRNQVMQLSFGEYQGKFNIHSEEFLEKGKQHKLIFITDVSTMLRSEELNAWKRLVRVISHEINNSLSPITSISETLLKDLRAEKDQGASAESFEQGLSIISERSHSLKSFVNSYRQIAQLPKPDKKETSILKLIEKTCALFNSTRIVYADEKDMMLNIDPVQIEQVLINVIKNAIEAMEPLNNKGVITIDWESEGRKFRLSVSDEGTGISNIDNLFVPFYTTKKQGSGIGLALSRQILEAHNGSLIVKNREDLQGCRVIMEIIN